MPRSKESFAEMRQNAREKIETAAVSLFARKGLSVTVGEIAKAAGVSQGLLYSHYPSKDALIFELVRQATFASSKSLMEIADRDAPSADKIKQITALMCFMFKEAPYGIDYFMYMIQASMSGVKIPEEVLYSEELKNPVEILMTIIMAGQVEGTVVAGDALLLSVTYWAVIQGWCCYVITGMPVTPDAEMINRILLI